MAISGVLGRSNLFGLELRAELSDEIYAGIETLVIIRLRNRRRWLPACLLRLAVAGGAAACPVLLPRGEVHLPLPATFPRRGIQPLGDIRVSSPFPITFFVRSIALPLATAVVVFPTPRPAPRPGGEETRSLPGEAWSGKGYEGELSRIGDYRGSEPMKMIHWKLTARHGRLMVKELSAATAPPLVIDLEQLPGRGPEERLEAASWLITRASRAGRPVGLQLEGGTIPAASGRRHKLHLLGALARYGRHPSSP